MAFEFPCPLCAQTISAFRSAAGKEVVCASCGKLALVPEPPPVTEPPPVPMAEVTARNPRRVEVLLKNQPRPNWPSICACCGGSAETAILITDKKFEEHQTKRADHRVPSCNFCTHHQEVGAAPDRYGVGCAAGTVIIGLAAWAALSNRRPFGTGTMSDVWTLVLIEVAWVILYFFIRTKIAMRNRDDAQAMMSARCTGTVFADFERQYSGVFDEKFIDRFWFTNAEYAMKFRNANSSFC